MLTIVFIIFLKLLIAIEPLIFFFFLKRYILNKDTESVCTLTQGSLSAVRRNSNADVPCFSSAGERVTSAQGERPALQRY